MQIALERSEGNKATVVPILLRPFLWKDSSLANLKPLPENGEAVTSGKWHSKDEAFESIVKSLRNIINKRYEQKTKKETIRKRVFHPIQTGKKRRMREKAYSIISGFLLLFVTLLGLHNWRMLTDAHETNSFLYNSLRENLKLAANRGDLVRAEQIMREFNSYYSKLKVRNEGHFKNKTEALIWHYQGFILLKKDESEKSLEVFTKAVNARRNLAVNKQIESVVELGSSLVYQGVAYQHQGDYDLALNLYNESVSLLREAAQSHPERNAVNRIYYLGMFRQARIARLKGDGCVLPREKEAHYIESYNHLNKCRDLVENQIALSKGKDSSTWYYHYGFVLSSLGRLEIKLRNIENAEALFMEASKHRNDMANKDSGNTNFSTAFAESVADQATLAFVKQDFDAALKYSEEATKKHHDNIEKNKRSIIHKNEQVLVTAQILKILGRDKEADRLLLGVIEDIDRIAGGHSKDIWLIYAEACMMSNSDCAKLDKVMRRINKKGIATERICNLKQGF